MQYRNGSQASPWVTGWLFTGAVALITSNREVRRRSSFGRRTPPLPIRVPLYEIIHQRTLHSIRNTQHPSNIILSTMKLHLAPFASPRGSSPPPSPPRYAVPKAAAAAAVALLAAGATRTPHGAVRGFFGLPERCGGAGDISGAAFARGALLDDPGTVPDDSVANVRLSNSDVVPLCVVVVANMITNL